MPCMRDEFVVAYLPEHGKGLNKAIKAIQKLKRDNDFGQCISGPALTMINGEQRTYTLGPDGSGEGWEDSDKGDLFRRDFIVAAKLHEYAKIAHFSMGEDDIISYHEYSEEDE